MPGPQKYEKPWPSTSTKPKRQLLYSLFGVQVLTFQRKPEVLQPYLFFGCQSMLAVGARLKRACYDSYVLGCPFRVLSRNNHRRLRWICSSALLSRYASFQRGRKDQLRWFMLIWHILIPRCWKCQRRVRGHTHKFQDSKALHPLLMCGILGGATSSEAYLS